MNGDREIHGFRNVKGPRSKGKDEKSKAEAWAFEASNAVRGAEKLDHIENG